MLFMLYLSAMFGCAYFARNRLLLFRTLSIAVEYLSYPQRPQMALVYSLVFLAVSLFYLAKLLTA